MLPFALDGDSGARPAAASPARGGFGSPTTLPAASGGARPADAAPAPAPAAQAAAAEPPPASDPDAAVGAFVRLLQEAPPLSCFGAGGGGSREGAAPAPALDAGAAPRLTLQAGLRQLELLRERLHSRGAVRSVVDA